MSAANAPTQSQLEKDIELIKLIRSRGLVPLITAEERPDVPRLSDVQGDVIYGFPKASLNHALNIEWFFFFRIADSGSFKAGLSNPDFKPTSSEDVKNNLLKIGKARQEAKLSGEEVKRVKLQQYQIAFSKTGLLVLGIQDGIADARFDQRCMRDDRVFLGDQGKWDDLFDKPGYNEKDGSAHDVNNPRALHGVFVIAGDDDKECADITEKLKGIFKSSIEIPENGIVQGHVRPERHLEHFGFRDGISQPAIRNLEYPLPGQNQVDPGVIVTGYKGDPVGSKRPDWAKNGAMLVFRKLEQSVVAWDNYMLDHGQDYKDVPGGKAGVNPELSQEDGAKLLAARLVGRWPSGAPIALKETSLKDDPKMGEDPKRNNNFDYSVYDVPGVSAQTPSDYYCPFTAHVRKTAPRNLDPYVARQYLESGSIIRAGITYGPEVTQKERDDKKDSEEEKFKRGLLFVCYASHLDSGFVRQTTGYGNNDFFPITGLVPNNHGQDPIIGGPPAKGSSGEERDANLDAKPAKPFANGDQLDIKLKVPGDTLNRYQVTGHVEIQPLTQAVIDFPFFVTSRGGEYFFVPSIPTLKTWGTAN
ncbi:unnamed protein product [Rhizoctonia solani]|uniref:DyP dimeric alpha+beta barrel domain-containing protein n=1 Tax=Rhizoctonia solani TaxID=456999 RepID=A0A8H3AVB6_9AGAM|nr:unnamed protein product [Rhizoctonia solani]